MMNRKDELARELKNSKITANYLLVRKIQEELQRNNLTISIAESLTGGMLASTFIDVPGSSEVINGAVVSYTSSTKRDILGVKEYLLEKYGSVDPQVCLDMADGVRFLMKSDYGIATTGVAGPGSYAGIAEGTVYVAVSYTKGWNWRKLDLSGSRQNIREETTALALELLLGCLRIE